MAVWDVDQIRSLVKDSFEKVCLFFGYIETLVDLSIYLKNLQGLFDTTAVLAEILTRHEECNVTDFLMLAKVIFTEFLL